jgi:magnesium chelatase family protein
MNPCPCGHLEEPALACGRAPKCAQDYQSRISGPLFDRIDLHIDVPAVSAADLTLPPPSEGSTQVAARVARARAIQAERYKQNGNGIRTNAEADGELLERIAPLDEPSRKLVTQAIERFRLSARGFHRVLRVARTLADLEGGGAVKQIHVAESLTYRRVLPGR